MKKKQSAKAFWTKLIAKKGALSIISSVVAIICGLLVGLIILFCLNPGAALSGFGDLLSSGVSNLDKFSKVFYTAAPLVMTGLAVGFAFKTGLFNIGAPGQYLTGAFVALFFALVVKAPWYVCVLAAGLVGALWGAIPGLFKAFLNVNEVITSIMFNWVAIFLCNLLVANTPGMLASSFGGSDSSRTVNIEVVNPSGLLPNLGLSEISSYLNIGIFITVIFAVIVYIILMKTTFGYELMACGHNKDASKYAGINEKRNIVLSMVIAGFLAGVGGAIAYLSGTTNYQINKILPANGFNGIPVALLANSHPLGTIAAALFISYIQVGGTAMQPTFAVENINIIIGVIIYLSAFALLVKGVIGKLTARSEDDDGHLFRRKKKRPVPEPVKKEGE